MAQYKTLTSNIPELQRRVKAVQRKLQKHNLTCEFALGEEYAMPIPHYTEVDTPFGVELARTDDIICSVTEYQFSMPAFKINGWTLVSTIEHNKTTDGSFCNTVNLMPNVDINVPKMWFNIKPACEHCNSNRLRKSTLMFQNTLGEFKQVGASCMHDFIGISADDVLKSFKDIQNFIDQELKYVGPALAVNNYRVTVDFLADSIAQIDESGYHGNGNTTHVSWCRHIHTDQDVELANQIINFFTTSDDPILDDPFYLNIKSALSLKYTKKTGLVSYAYVAYQKIMSEIEERDDVSQSSSEWVGNIKDRCKFQLSLINCYISYNYFGTTYIYKFKDVDDNIFVWYASNSIPPYEGFAEVTGTIKDHSTYNDEKQTVLTRCKVVVPEV